MAETRPRGEQLRFTSSKSGSHILDDYLEAAELGDRSLADLLSDVWDTDGALRSDLHEWRINSDILQTRFGDFASPSAGWQDVTDGYIFRQRGAHANATAYKRLDVVTYDNSVYICATAHTSASSVPHVSNFVKVIDASAFALASHTHDTRYYTETEIDGFLTTLDTDKLDAADYTASDVLTKLLTVDGSGSGLDADLLDGQHGSYYLARANHTGSQAISTITSLQATLDAKLAIASNLSDVASAATAFGNIKQDATTSATGVVELATDAEAQAKTDTVRALTPSNLAALGISDSQAGLVEAAVQSEMEAASSTTLAVTPGRQQYHPSAAKFWIYVTLAAGVVTTRASYNVTSVTDHGVGNWTINIATDFSDVYWCPQISSGAYHHSLIAIDAGTLNFNCYGSTHALADPTKWSACGFGDQ